MHFGMPYEFFPLFWTLFLFLGSWGLILVGRNIKAKTRLRENEMIHEERIEAMQKGLTVPAAPEPPSTLTPAAVAGPSTPAIDWVRVVSLALGLLFLLTGIGMCTAFLIGEGFGGIWSMGLIPAMAGIGLLLFYRLSRRFQAAEPSS